MAERIVRTTIRDGDGIERVITYSTGPHGTNKEVAPVINGKKKEDSNTRDGNTPTQK